jgi:hypothetical protein
MRRLALLLVLLSPLPVQAASPQSSLTIASQHCVWREGDDPDGKLGWAAPVLDESGWQPVASWSGLATPTPRFWLRCLFQPSDLAPAPIVKPVMQVSGDLAYEAFVDGQLPPCESGLPLGILDDSIYSAATLRLAHGDQLTILSDGVLEARNPTGELFGFDRTAAISTQSAEAIATAAQHFGQDDDITVLTIHRTNPTGAAHA